MKNVPVPLLDLKVIEAVAQQFGDTAAGTVAEEDEAEDERAEPGFGDGQGEQDRALLGGRLRKGPVQGVVGAVQLLLDERAADILWVGPLRDGTTGPGVAGEPLAGVVGKESGWGTAGRPKRLARVECPCLGPPEIGANGTIPSIYEAQALSAAPGRQIRHLPVTLL